MKMLISLLLIGITTTQAQVASQGNQGPENQNDSGDLRIQVVTPASNRCEEEFKEHGYEAWDYICNYNISWSKWSINRVPWDEYFQCLDNNKSYFNYISGIQSKCYDQYKNKFLSSGDVHVCLQKLVDLNARSSYNDCFNPATGKNIVRDTFDQCMETLKESNQAIWSKVNTCSSDYGQEKTQCWQRAMPYLGDSKATTKCNDYNTRNSVTS